MPQFTRQTELGPVTFTAREGVTEGEIQDMVANWVASMRQAEEVPGPEPAPAPEPAPVMLAGESDAPRGPELIEQLPEEPIEQAYVPGIRADTGRSGITVFGPADAPTAELAEAATGRRPPADTFLTDPAFYEQVAAPSVEGVPGLFIGAAKEAVAGFTGEDSRAKERQEEARRKIVRRIFNDNETNILVQGIEEDFAELLAIFGSDGGPTEEATEIEGTFGFEVPEGATTDDIRAIIQSKKAGREAGREMMGSFKAALDVTDWEAAIYFWLSDPVEAGLEATWLFPGLDPATLAVKAIGKGGDAAITGLRLLSNANKIRRRTRAAYQTETALAAEVGAQRAQGAVSQAEQGLASARAEATGRALSEIPDAPPLTSDRPPTPPDQSLIQADMDLGAANVQATMADDAAALAADQAATARAQGEARIAELGDEITQVRELDLVDAPPKRPEEPNLMDSDASPDQAARDASDVISHDIVHGDGGTRQAMEMSNSGAANANAMKNADMEAFGEFVQEGLDMAGDGRRLAEMPPVQRVTYLQRAKQLAESGFVVKEMVEVVVDGKGTGRFVETGRLLIDENEVLPLIGEVLDQGKMPSSLEQLAMARYARQVGVEIREAGEIVSGSTEAAVAIKAEMPEIRKKAQESEGGTLVDPKFRQAQDDLIALADQQNKFDGIQDAKIELFDRAKLAVKRAGTLAAQMLNERKMPIHQWIGEEDFLAAAARKNENKPLSRRRKAKISKDFQKLQGRIDNANRALEEAESSLGRAREEATGRLEAGDPAADAAAAQAKADKVRATARKKAKKAIGQAEKELERAKKAAEKAEKKAAKLEAQRAAKEQRALARELKKEEVARLREEQKAIREEIKQARADQRRAESIATKAQRKADAAATKLEKQLEKIAKAEEKALDKAAKAERRRIERAKSKRAKDIADQDPKVQEAQARVLDAKKKMADAEAAKLIAYDQLSKGPGGLIASSILRAASASTMLTTSAEWSYLGMQFSGGLAWATLLETGLFLRSGFKEKVPGTTVALTTKEAVKAMFSPSSARRMAVELRSNPRAALYDDVGVSFKTVEDIGRLGGDGIEEMMRAFSKQGLFGKESNIPVLAAGKRAMSGMLRRSNNAIALSGNVIRYSLMDIFSSSGLNMMEMERIAHLVNLSTGTFEFRPRAMKPGTGLSQKQLGAVAEVERQAIGVGSHFLIAPKLYAAVIKRPFVVGAMALSGNAAVRNAALTYMGMSALRTMSYGMAAYLAARFYDDLSEEESWTRGKLAMVPGSPYEGKVTLGDEQFSLDGGTTGTLTSAYPSIGISGQERLNAIERLNYYLESPDFDYTKLKLLGDDYFARAAKGMVKYKLHPAWGALHDMAQSETFYGADIKQEDFKSKQAYWFNRVVMPMISSFTPFTGQSLTKSAIGQVEQARGITDPSQSEFIGKDDAHLLKSPAWMFALKTVLEPFGITSSISRHKIDEKKKKKGAAPRVPRSRGLGGGLGGGGLGGGL